MKSYLLPGLDDARRQSLVNADVRFYNWDSGGVIIEGDEQLQLALRTLGLTATERPTEYANLFQLSLNSPGDRAEAPLTAEAVEARAKSRANYIKVCSTRLQGLLEAAEKRLAESKATLPAVETELVSAARQDFVAGRSMDVLQQRSAFREELERLGQVPKVLDVQCVTNRVLVFTDTLCARNPANNATHEIGKFMLSICLDGSQNGVRFFNSSRRVDGFGRGMNAPNVYSSGCACIDEIQQALLELIARFEFAALADIAIQFIESAGDDDFLGKFVGNWPAFVPVSTMGSNNSVSTTAEDSRHEK